MMNWIFWALLIAGIVLVLWPFFIIAEAAVSAALWIIGAILIVSAILWAVGLFRRAVSAPTSGVGM